MFTDAGMVRVLQDLLQTKVLYKNNMFVLPHQCMEPTPCSSRRTHLRRRRPSTRIRGPASASTACSQLTPTPETRSHTGAFSHVDHCVIFTFNKHFDKENDCVHEPVIMDLPVLPLRL